MDALILVDLQNDFLPGGTLAVPHGDEVIPVANRWASGERSAESPPAGASASGGRNPFGLVVATQDWHPADHGSFASNHPGKQPGDQIELDGRAHTLWPVHCVQGTRGAELAAQLDRSLIDRVFVKGDDPRVDSYSGFFDNGRKRSTGLGEFLRQRGVTDVYLLGLATDYCVKATAIDATQLGFKTHLIVEGCRGVELQPGDVQKALDDMRREGVHILGGDAPIKSSTSSNERILRP